MPTYKYGAVLRATAAASNVKPEAMPAFEARVRRMRALGVPPVKFVRSGIAGDYSRENAIELLLTLEAQRLGQAPKASVMVARSIMGQCNMFPASDDEHEFVAFERADQKDYWVLAGRAAVLEWFETPPRGFTCLNVTATIQALDAALGTPDPTDDQRQEE